MKHRSTTPTVSKFSLRQWLLVGMAVLVAGASVSYIGTTVLARDYDAEIRAKEREAAQYQAEASRLAGEADSLQRELGILNNQISQIQAEIAASQNKHDKLVEDIEKSKKQIEQNREALGGILSDMYVDDKISPLEMLASSNSIGDYIDKQEQRATLRQGLNDKIKEIRELQKKLEKSRDEVKRVLEDQKLKRDELGSKQAVQKGLLDRTRGDEAAYQQLVQDRQGEINKLRQAQEEMRNRTVNLGSYVPTSGTGGYPWAGAGYPCWSSSCVDPWALYYLECTSYVAWRLDVGGRHVGRNRNTYGFGGAGHAYQWPATTSSWSGVSQSYGQNPKVGDAAVLGAYVGGAAWTGHVMYVEEVYGNGSIRVSEYNWPSAQNGWRFGVYGEREFTPSEYRLMTFITFPSK